MSDPASPPAPPAPPPNSQPLPGALSPTPAPSTAQRPDFVEETFWDAAAGTIKAEPLAKSYSELRAKFSKGVDGYKAELLKSRPEKPEAYAFKAEGKIAERLAARNLVIMTEKPGADFKPEPGKQYLQLNAADPMLAYWRKTAFEAGMSQEQFADGLATYAESLVAKQPTEAQIKAERTAEFAKLGENGAARADHVWKQLQGKLGEDKAKALDGVVQSAAAIEAIEALLEKSGEPKFSPAAGAGGAPQNAEALKAELAALQADYNNYWQPHIQARVTAINKLLYPGPSTGVVPGSNLGPSRAA